MLKPFLLKISVLPAQGTDPLHSPTCDLALPINTPNQMPYARPWSFKRPAPGSKNTYGSEGPRRPRRGRDEESTGTDWSIVRRGQGIVREWLDATEVEEKRLGMEIDYHDVIDTITDTEKWELRVDLEHDKYYYDGFAIVSSYGWSHNDDIIEESKEDLLMEGIDGFVFTSDREYSWPQCEVSRPAGWPKNAIRVLQDKSFGKSFVSRLLRVPTMLIDDKEDNVDVHRKGHDLNGHLVCKRGRKGHHRMRGNYMYQPDPSKWYDVYLTFCANVARRSDFEPRHPDWMERWREASQP